MFHPLRAFVPIVLFVLFAAACGGDTDGTPQITAFTAASPNVAPGASVLLSWQTRNAVHVSLTSTPDNVLPAGEIPLTGTSPAGPMHHDTVFKLSVTGADGTEVERMIEVKVSGLEIQSFTATPEMVASGGEVTLAYRIDGAPSSVTITDENNVQVFDGQNHAEGSTVVMPTKATTYRLRAVAGEQTYSKDVAVTITAPGVSIDSFTAGTVSATGQRVHLAWTTSNATEIQLERDGVPIRPWTDNNVASGSAEELVINAHTTFKLSAKNLTAFVERELEVTAAQGPKIVDFMVTPSSYSTPTAVATLTYTTEFATSVALTVNSRPVDDLPSDQLSGTHTFTVSGGAATVRLTATNDAGSINRIFTIETNYEDHEPNDQPSEAIAVSESGVYRGRLLDGDVDFYAITVSEGARIHAVTNGMTPVCNVDTALRFIAPDGVTILGTIDEVVYPFRVHCAELNPGPDSYADNLPAGTYYLAVEGGALFDAPSEYVLEIEISGPPTPLSGFSATPIGTPAWSVADCQMFNAVVGLPMSAGPSYLEYWRLKEEMYRPLHHVPPQFVEAASEIPHVRDYNTELSTIFAVRGEVIRNQFTLTEVTAPEGIVFACMVIADPNSAPGDSTDGPDLPIMPNALFPMNDDVTINLNGQFYASHTTYLGDWRVHGPSAAHDGQTHRILDDFYTDTRPMTGDYTAVHHLVDTSGSGWEITFTFTAN